jgi:hypothetical protein
VSKVSKKKPYSPKPGLDPEKIHRALKTINIQNGWKGATLEEIAAKVAVALELVLKEMQWGPEGERWLCH